MTFAEASVSMYIPAGNIGYLEGKFYGASAPSYLVSITPVNLV